MEKQNLIAAVSLLLCLEANAGQLVGKAVDLKTGQHLYTENHDFALDNGAGTLTTTYLTPKDEVKASRVVRYTDGQVSEYRLSLRNIEYEEGVRKDGESITFLVDKPDAEPAVEKREIRSGKRPVIDAGFNDYLLSNWDSLIGGDRLTFYFASTARMDLVRLQVTLDEQMTSDSMAVFSMTAANPIFRLLVEPVKVGFYRDTRQLAYYRGVSNLKADSGEAYDVEITFANDQLQAQGGFASR